MRLNPVAKFNRIELNTPVLSFDDYPMQGALMSEATITQLTAEIVANYVANHPVSTADLPGLIATVYTSLTALGEPAPAPVEVSDIATAAAIRKSIKPEGLVSFLDGKTYQTLKRHLTTKGLTVKDYKAKFGLPKDYPIVATGYAARRSELAKLTGLGNMGRNSPSKKPTAPAKPPKPRGRPKKALAASE